MRAIQHRVRGFTLIELVVAMFIAAVMFVMGYGALRQALQNRERVAASQDRLVALQTAVRVLTQDFAQVAPRPIRDVLGSGVEAAIFADPRTQTLVTFTRDGWANPSGLPRSTMQRVSYEYQNGSLWRLHWPVLDATQGTISSRRELLKDVTAVKFRYLANPGEWHEEWPPQGAQNAPGAPPGQLLRLRPLAVEITLEGADFGSITRVVEVH